MTTVNQKLNKDLDKAKIGLLQTNNGKTAFISTILFSLKFSWDNSIPTAGTDGLKLVVSPDFFEGLTQEERVFLLAHEAWHVAFCHMARMNEEKRNNFRIWNMACDYYINQMLVSNGFKMIDGGLIDYKYSDQSYWSSDKIFDDLMQQAKDNEEMSEDEKNFIEDMSQGNDDDTEEEKKAHRAKVERNIEDTLVKASVRAKMSGEAGSIPNEIQIALDKLLNPKLPWNVILQKYMNAYAKEDYSFKRPNKRFANQSAIMPSLYSESLGHIACAVDTSCSVSDEQFNMFRTELDSIKKKLNPKLMTVIDFDTSIKKVHKLKQSDSIEKVQFSGRGGTYMHPVFDYFSEPSNKPNVLIVFSDMECEPITIEPKFDVIWIKLDGYGFDPSFGKVIDLEE